MGDPAQQMSDEDQFNIDDDPDQAQGDEDRGDQIEPPADASSLEAVAEGGDDDAAGDAAGDGDAAQAPPHMIPKSRFDEVNEERKWLRQQLERTHGTTEDDGAGEGEADQSQQPEPFDFDGAEDQYMEAMYNGDKEEAKRIRRQINEENRKVSKQDAAQTVSQEATQREQTADLNAAASEVIQRFPQLNSEDENTANADAISRTVMLRNAYINEGYGLGESLRHAAADAAKLFDLNDTTKAPDSGGEPDRTTQARRRNAEAANRQPPAMPGIGSRGQSDTDVDVESMSEDEFDNLSEAEKSRLRGD